MKMWPVKVLQRLRLQSPPVVPAIAGLLDAK